MSQRNRIVLATATLLGALFLALPSPSRAASHPWKLPVFDPWERAWTWLLHILPGGATQKPGVQEKEGGMINPNGGTASTTPTSSGSQPDAGGTINSNGIK